MRIKQATIYGFGKWVDTEWTFPETGPVVLYGENESGKTTLHQFILFMLFGLPPRERKFYQPKTSSKMGGRLRVSAEEIGGFTIERLDAKNQARATCFLPNGEERDEEWLQEQLEGIDQKTYEAIFSFSSFDLSAIMTMKEEDLAEILLSIGMTGSSNIYIIEKKLEARLAELFKPAGKIPLINKQLASLDQLSNELQENKKAIASYREQTEKIDAVLQELKEIEQNIQTSEAEKNQLMKIQTALPIIQEYHSLHSIQNGYQANPPFPTNGIKRLENVNENLRPLESDYAVLDSQSKRVQGKIDDLKEEMLSEEVYAGLKQAKNIIDSQLILEQEISTLKEQIELHFEQVSEEATDLQLDETVIKLEEIILPFYIEETWKQLKTESETLAITEAAQIAEERSLDEEAAYIDHQADGLKAEILPAEKVVAMTKRRAAAKEFEQFKKWQEESQVQNEQIKEKRAAEQKRANLVLGSSVLLSVIGFVLGFTLEQGVFNFIGLLILFIGIGQWLLLKNNWKRLAEFVQEPQTVEKHVVVSESELRDIERALAEDEQNKASLALLEGERKKQQIQQVKLEEKKRILLERKNRLEQQIAEQHVLYPFLEQTAIVYWPEYYQRLERLLTLNVKHNELKSDWTTCRKEYENKAEQVNQLLKQVAPTLINKEKTSLLAELTTIIRNQELVADRLQEEEKECVQLQIEIQDKQKRMHVFRDEKQALFNIAEVSEEENYYERNQYLNDKQAYEEKLLENEQQLATIFPNRSWKNVMKAPVGKIEIEQRLAHNTEQLKMNKQKQDEYRDQLSELQALRNQMESEERYSERIHQFEIEKASLELLAEEWTLLKIEKEVLRETKQQYKEKYLTSVMEETSTFFEIMTAGQYIHVYAPDEKAAFLVESSIGMRYRVDELSQGTMHQLYVALRFAINKVMADKHKLPFILDDAFVHFDGPRTEQMMQVIKKIAQTQQVILLTCKQDIRHLSESLQIPVIKL